MHSIRTLTLAIAFVLPAAGCDLESASLFERSAEAEQDRAEAPEHRGPHHPPPPVMLMHLAMETGELHDDPTMAEALAVMEASHTEARTAQDALRTSLATAAAEGTVSTEAVTTELAAVEAAAQAEAKALTAALDQAHALLDAELREEVIELLLDGPPPPDEASAPGGPPPPDGAKGHRPPPGASSDEARPPADEHRPRGPMGHLLGELELDDSQREALRASLGEPTPPERPQMPDLESFVDDDFEAEALGLVDLHVAHSTERTTRHVELLSALVPLLREDQLATLVERLNEGPPEPPARARA
ncbi:MAG: hypothetical protein AAGF11_27220 [Myxococcota bacterium]